MSDRTLFFEGWDELRKRMNAGDMDALDEFERRQKEWLLSKDEWREVFELGRRGNEDAKELFSFANNELVRQPFRRLISTVLEEIAFVWDLVTDSRPGGWEERAASIRESFKDVDLVGLTARLLADEFREDQKARN